MERKARQFPSGAIFGQSTRPTAVQTPVTSEKRARKVSSAICSLLWVLPSVRLSFFVDGQDFRVCQGRYVCDTRIFDIARGSQLIWTPGTATTVRKLHSQWEDLWKALDHRQNPSTSHIEMDPHPFPSYYPPLPPLPPAMRPFPFPTTSNASPSNRGMIFYPQPLPMADTSPRDSAVESDQ